MAHRICWLVLPFLIVAPALPATLLVQPGGTGDYPTIQAAVDAASDGDEILLGDGTFTGAGNHAVDYLGKAVSIRSVSGVPEAVVVDCDPNGLFGEGYIGFRFHSGEGPGSRLEGITIVHSGLGISSTGASPVIEDVIIRDGCVPAVGCTGSLPVLRGCVIESNVLANTRAGYAYGTVVLHGADATIESCTIQGNVWSGLRVRDSSPTVRDCRIDGNHGGDGAGIEVIGHSSPLIERCTITGNVATSYGGGLFVATPAGTQVIVSECTIAGNVGPGGGGGIGVRNSDALVVDGCTITGNRSVWGAGVHLSGGSFASVEGCTITRNEGSAGGGLFVSGNSAASIGHSILWGNCASGNGAEMWIGRGATVDLSCVDVAQSGVFVYGEANLTWAGDVLDTDPLFCDPLACGLATGGVYTVSTASPVLGQACGAMGAQGAGCTATPAGASLEASSWGAIKARFR